MPRKSFFNGVADPDWKMAEAAVEEGDMGPVRAYLDAGGDVNKRCLSGNTTLLMWAAFCKQPEIAALLLEKGADVGIRDTASGHTALIWAARAGQDKIADMILAKNPEIDYRDSDGATALMYAVRYGSPEMVGKILDKGARTDIADDQGMTALDHATEPQNQGEDEAMRKRDAGVLHVLETVMARRAEEQRLLKEARDAALQLTADTVEACRNGTREAVTLSRKLTLKTPVSAR